MLYTDPDGQFAFALPLVSIGWSGITWLTSEVVLTALGIAAVTYGTYEVCQFIDRQNDYHDMAFQHEINAGTCYHKSPDAGDEPRESGKYTYPGSPAELDKHPDWENITHPEAAARGRRIYKNRKTGDIIEFDKGKSGQSKHGGKDHYHRRNPDSLNKHDKYIDNLGNPCGKNKHAYHLYPPKDIKWEFE